MKNKKLMISIGAAILIILVAVVLILVFRKKDDEFTFKASGQIASSLMGATQKEREDFIKSDLEKNGYTLEKAMIYINPYDISPLSALITFKTDTESSVKVTVKGKENNDLVTDYDKAVYHYIPVYGLYANYENIVEIELDNGSKGTFKIKTELEEDLPVSTVSASTSDKDNLYFLTSPITMKSYAFDSKGEIRWIAPINYYHDIERLDNGHLLIGTGGLNEFGLTTKIAEIDYLGKVYKEYDIPEGFLNDIYVMENGNILVASKNKDRATYSEYIIEIDKETGKIVKTFDVFKTLEDIDPVFINEISNASYFYNSGIDYDKATNSLVLTYWGGEFVISMNYDNSKVNWILSNPKNFSEAFSEYLLKGSDGFTYPKSMHSAHIDGNTLKVFDNGYSTIEGISNSSKLVGSYSSANTYEINGKNISLKNSYDENKRNFSYALGDYTHANGEVILFGRELRDLNYNTATDINDYYNISSRLIEKVDGANALDMTIDIATHTVDKIKVSGHHTFAFAERKYLTTRVPSEKESITPEIIEQVKKATEPIEYEFGYNNSIIEHNVLFMSMDEAKLILIDEAQNGAVYTLKVKGEEKSEIIVTDLPAAKYYVYVLENGVMYKTDKFIEIK